MLLEWKYVFVDGNNRVQQRKYPQYIIDTIKPCIVNKNTLNNIK